MTAQSLVVHLQRPDGSWLVVGRLFHKDEKNWFEFDSAYWERPHRAVLGQIFEEHGRAWMPNSHVALPRWFSHLLPEGVLRTAVAHAAGVNYQREFQLMARLGRDDLPGATRIAAEESHPGTDPPPPASERANLDEDPVLKFSLAGAQLKFSMLDGERGLTIPVAGQAGDYIVKFPDFRAGFAGVPEAELAGLELARAIGIDTPSARLVDSAEIDGLGAWAQRTAGRSLAVSRFDRIGPDRRVHMEEIAQIVDIPTGREHAKYRYANYETVAVLYAAIAGIDTVGEVIDRMVLNVLIGNADAHLKNWAVVYPDGVNARISPVYDVVPTVLWIDDHDLALNLDGSKPFARVAPRSFATLGARSGYGAERATQRAHEAGRRVLDAWEVLAEHLPSDAFRALTERRDTLGLPG